MHMHDACVITILSNVCTAVRPLDLCARCIDAHGARALWRACVSERLSVVCGCLLLMAPQCRDVKRGRCCCWWDGGNNVGLPLSAANSSSRRQRGILFRKGRRIRWILNRGREQLRTDFHCMRYSRPVVVGGYKVREGLISTVANGDYVDSAWRSVGL